MAAKLKVVMFLGSVRDNRMCERVSKLMRRHMESKYELSVVDPMKIQAPMVAQPLHFYPDRSQAPEWLRDLNTTVENADCFVMLTAEYNNSVPPGLTNILSYIPPKSFAYKPSGIVSYSMGPYGGVRAASHLRDIVAELGTPSTPIIFAIPQVQNALSAEGDSVSERMDSGAQRLITQLDWYARAMRSQREAEGVPQ